MLPLRDSTPSNTFPLITVGLIIVNIAVFLYMLILPERALDSFIAQYALIPREMSFRSIITSQFLHAGFLHIIGNMLFLHIFGDNLEDRLGHLKFLLFYLLCGIAAGLMQVFINPDSIIPVLGASGAIAGVMGGYLILFPHSRIDMLVFLGFFITTVRIPAALMLLYWAGLQLLYGTGSIGTDSGGVAYFAHIGGFIAGLLIVALVPKRRYYSG